MNENIVHWTVTPPHAAGLFPMPAGLAPALRDALEKLGYRGLYSHQIQAYQHLRLGQNAVVSTSTASGKTLCYNLPVFDALFRDPSARAIYIFPTKALAHDQEETLTQLDEQIGRVIPVGAYDGDTPTAHRAFIRSNAHILLTNPDMLHTGILPQHTSWAEFFRNLRFVVLDELHIYRGVFGSHVANVIRRLKRVAAHYGAHPQFILTSATISNPQELAERLVEEKCALVDEDSSPNGQKNFILYNPPIIDPDLGIRSSASSEGVRLAGDLLAYRVQTILFARARRSVEMILRALHDRYPKESGQIHGYRSGYLASERRAIERGLRSGNVRAVVATSALELGIDIGGMDASIVIGYPGTVASLRQQIGRAGRRRGTSVGVLVASAAPIDQYLMQHPEFAIERSPENALINPDNPLILLQHIRCAAFELPFKPGEKLGSIAWDTLKEFLDILEQAGVLHSAASRYYWVADQYPAQDVSLRNATAQNVILRVEGEEESHVIGTIDQLSATWMVHPGAIYLHEGQSYRVKSLDLENSEARLAPSGEEYFTEPKNQTEVEKISIIESAPTLNGEKTWGEIRVTTQVVGFRKIHWITRETLGQETLDLPPNQLRTTGYWFTLQDEAIEYLRQNQLWTNDVNDYGPNWNALRQIVRQRDHFTCQMCGAVETDRAHHVHHKIPLRSFASLEQANALDNLITLCPSCHRKAELVVKIRSGLSGVRYVLNQLAPLFVMCDTEDLGAVSDIQSPLADGRPAVLLYDQVPAGIGLSEALYHMHDRLLNEAMGLVSRCPCQDGCPSCVGPGGENGAGGKQEALALLQVLTRGEQLVVT
ncbi:distinct helicase family with a unique C-terminal domain including a metal-binding cysteine cluster [Longilinea arvoryzae]|uniref:Distinct helicase family with a unique C-terminal domain including a metal-binding cysteine cluster n=1 Tax=Longilinea arvoryzae TaxID=360412 RepID=A0A0S7BKD8_9CHLR|nr:DEAD/DEAH box helicase [Longilinea arvoryzae]GAP14690.1 distinct helicase family with a unique C-terminal domain including a metal-binding cysteine cluster [Longilinea arvoryzae]